MKKASKKKATSVASPHEKNVELKSLPARVCRSGLAGTPDGPDDNLVLDGPTSIKPYQATAQFASESGEGGEISDGSGWHQGEFDFPTEGAAQLKPGPMALPTDSEPAWGVEIGDFSLVGFDNPEIENGVEGAFLGVKSSEVVRLRSVLPSDSPVASEDPAPASEQS